jgi:hypothetical protein
MSNASVIQRIHKLLDLYDAKEVSPHEFEQAIEFHMDALEGVEYSAIHRARRLTGRIVCAHREGEEEFCDSRLLKDAIQEFREFLAGLDNQTT